MGFLPATGLPTRAAMPWNSSRRPNAFVSFSSPSNSTKRMERREANAAESTKKKCKKKWSIMQDTVVYTNNFPAF